MEGPERAEETRPLVRAPEAAPVTPGAQVLWLQQHAGNRATARMLGARSVARFVDARAEGGFNPNSIVHDLRRAIDQSDITEGWVSSGPYSLRPTQRKVDAGLVIRVLDGLTKEQVERVEEIYEQQEKSTLRNDLFAGGQSDAPSNLKPDQRARIEALMKGTAEAPGERAPQARLESLAIELHDLLGSKLDEGKRERVMVIFRRPSTEDIDAIDAEYQARYGHHPYEDLKKRLEGIHMDRVVQLRMGNQAAADALAIEDKRRALADLQRRAESGDLEFDEMANYEGKRRKLIDSISGLVSQAAQEAVADPANAGRTADEAVRERLARIMAEPVVRGGGSLADELAATLKGTEAAGLVAATINGSLVQVSARRLMEMEARGNTRAVKIADLMRGLRAQAEHDVMASIPGLPEAEKQALLANPLARKAALVNARAREYIEAFIRAYEDLRGDYRPWDEIVESSDDENEEMLHAMRAGGGEMADVDELRFAIRKRDASRIKAVLRKQGSQEKIQALENAYNARFEPDLKTVLFGARGARMAMMPISPATVGFGPLGTVRGRDAAHVEEYMQTPAAADMGGAGEAKWLKEYGALEVEVTEENSGLLGDLREVGADPETQKLMNESATQLKRLQKAYEGAADNPSLQQAILAEMRKVRATLTGDASAYEEENEAIAAQIRSAVSMAVQVALAVALPGVGTGLSGFIATTALNVGTSVASNMIIYGEHYSLSMFYADVVGGGFGALGGKLGDDFARLAGKQVAGNAAEGAIRAATEAGLSPALAREAAQAAALASEASVGMRALAEASNIAGSTAATSVVMDENGFTFEALMQNFLMNRLGQLRGGHEPAEPGKPRPADEPVPAETRPSEGGGPRPAPSAGGGGPAAPGSASERLHVRAMARSMEQLASQWPGLGEAGRRAELSNIANQFLGVRDAPNVRVTAERVGAGNDGDFNFKEWTIRVSPELINNPSMPPDLVAFMTDLARHESEHVLQWWSMARLRAAQGATGAEIAKEMYIPEDVAKAAFDVVARDGMSPAEQAAAQSWWDSVYSPASTRDSNLEQRDTVRKRLDELEAEIKAAEARGEAVDPAKIAERDQQRLLVEGFDAIYRNLPEEVIAYQRGGGARYEAQLMELELQVDLAQVALRHAVDDLKEIENDFLAQVASGATPDPELAADHASQLEKLRLMQERHDDAVLRRDTAAQWIAQQAAPQPATPPSGPVAPAGGTAPAGGAPPRTPASSSSAPPRNPAVEAGIEWIRNRFERRGLKFEDLGLGSPDDVRRVLGASPDPEASIAMMRQIAAEQIRDAEIAQSQAQLEGRMGPEVADPFGGVPTPTFPGRPATSDPIELSLWISQNGLDQPLELGAAIRYGPLDQLGRPTGIRAELRPGELEGGTEATYTPEGYGGEAANHARGHLLGNQLGGSGRDPRNIAVLYHIGANTPHMRDIENRIAAAVNGGDTIHYEVTPIFVGDSLLPTGIRLRAKGDTINVDVEIPNQALAAAAVLGG
jgi:hypothetical protein